MEVDTQIAVVDRMKKAHGDLGRIQKKGHLKEAEKSYPVTLGFRYDIWLVMAWYDNSMSWMKQEYGQNLRIL